jgi:hypothetical protein
VDLLGDKDTSESSDVYVSHTWSYLFDNVVQALTRELRPDETVWFCLLMNNRLAQPSFDLAMAMPPVERASFERALRHDYTKLLAGVSKVSLAHAKATRDSDSQGILAIVEACIGIATLDAGERRERRSSR